MRICRIMNLLPSDSSPGGGLGMYRLTQYIPEPCLLVVRASETYPPLPPHVRLLPLPLRDSTMPPRLRAGIFKNGAGARTRTQVQALLVARTLRYHARPMAMALGEIRRFDPDLVVCHSLQRLVYGIAARALLGCKLVLYLHGGSEIDALDRLPLLRLLLGIPDRVVALSPAAARQLAAWLPEETIWLTSTGVDTDVFCNWNLPRRRQLVSVAHLKWMKGHVYLLDAAARVFARFPDYRLLIVGEGEERGRILEAVEQRGLRGHVILTGILPRPDVVRVLNESRLFLLASTHEGLPKALLEAVACGTPAVVTDACNAEGIIDRTGVTVPARDHMALTQAITTLLSDETRWQECSRSGPEVAARYDWNVVAARDYAMYRAVVAGPIGQAAGPATPRAASIAHHAGRAPGSRVRGRRRGR